MSTPFKIPLSAGAQSFVVPLAGVSYGMRLWWCASSATPAWVLDISKEDGTRLVSGLPLVTGCDLLAQHAHLGIGGGLYVVSDTDPPTFDSLGDTTKLYFLPSS